MFIETSTQVETSMHFAITHCPIHRFTRKFMEKMQSNSRSNSNLRILPRTNWLVRWRKLVEMAGLWLLLAVRRYVHSVILSHSTVYVYDEW